MAVLPLPVTGDFNPNLTLRLLGFLRRNKVDVLVPCLMKDVRTAGLAGRMARTPRILARQGLVLCRPRPRYRHSFLRLTDGMIVNSAGIRDEYMGYGWFPEGFIHLVYNGMDPEWADVPDAVPDADPPMVLGAGRLDPQKSFGTLLEAAAMAMRDGRDWRFVIAGEGEQRGELERRVREEGLSNVGLPGHVEDLHRLMHRCSVFCLPSLFEGMPNVVMEAMAAGRPVAATDIRGTDELVVDGETGLLVPAADPEALYGALSELMDDRNLRRRMGESGRRRVEEHFSLERMLDRLEEVFMEGLRR